jgi:AcrR family transcriptional regulator
LSRRTKAKKAARPGRPEGTGRTRERILDVAERLFAKNGYAGTSLRDIAVLAGFTTALVNYYFVSKEKLFTEIFLRRGQPICAARMERLRILREEKPGAITVHDLVHAYVTPLLKIPRGAGVRRFLQIHARVHMEPESFCFTLRGKVYDQSTRAYAQAIHEVLPHLPLKTVYWRLILIVGANLYAVSDTNRIAELSDGVCNPGDLDEMYEQVVDFVCAGLVAPPRDQAPRYALRRDGFARKVAARSSASTLPEPNT